MKIRKSAPTGRGKSAGLALFLAAFVVPGCQTYKAKPLDLDGYGDALRERLAALESIRAEDREAFNEEQGLPESFDLTDDVTYAEGEVIALFYNADIRRSRARAGVTEATRETAGLWEDPVFGFDGAQIFSPTSGFDYGFTLGITLPVSGRLGVERDAASAEHEAQAGACRAGRVDAALRGAVAMDPVVAGDKASRAAAPASGCPGGDHRDPVEA